MARWLTRDNVIYLALALAVLVLAGLAGLNGFELAFIGHDRVPLDQPISWGEEFELGVGEEVVLPDFPNSRLKFKGGSNPLCLAVGFCDVTATIELITPTGSKTLSLFDYTSGYLFIEGSSFVISVYVREIKTEPDLRAIFKLYPNSVGDF